MTDSLDRFFGGAPSACYFAPFVFYSVPKVPRLRGLSASSKSPKVDCGLGPRDPGLYPFFVVLLVLFAFINPLVCPGVLKAELALLEVPGSLDDYLYEKGYLLLPPLAVLVRFPYKD